MTVPMPPDASQDPVRAPLAEQTLSLAALAARLSAADVAAPSALPGWTRGHVLAHVALNAEALLNVVRSASRGEVASMYPGRQERDAAIEAAAGDPPARHLEHVLTTAEELAAAWAALPASAHDVEFTSPAGWFRPVAVVPFFRWREVVLHQCDLHPDGAAARSSAEVLAAADPALVGRLLDETCTAFAARDDVPPLTVTATGPDRTRRLGAGTGTEPTTVTGPVPALVGWLTGRTAGAGLATSGPLPALPAWA